MKTTIKGHVIGYHFDWMKPGEIAWGFSECRDATTPSRNEVHAFAHSFEVDVPDSIDMVAAQIAALNAEKVRALDAYQASVREINDRLSKLQALTYVEQAA